MFDFVLFAITLEKSFRNSILIKRALQSRCTRFRFSPLEKDQVQLKLQEIIQAEGINVTAGIQIIIARWNDCLVKIITGSD